MILGRNAALWVGLVTAALNALVFVAGVQLTGDQVAMLNILGAALIGLVANESDHSTQPTFSARLDEPDHTRRADDPPAASS